MSGFEIEYCNTVHKLLSYRNVHILHLAANRGTGDLLSYLIKKFPDVSLQATDSDGCNLLHCAVTNSTHPDVLDILLKMESFDSSAKDG